MIIFNLSYVPDDLKNFIEISTLKSDALILDFTSSFDKENKYKVLYPSDVDKNNALHIAALNEYIKQMGFVSQAQLLNITGKDVRSFSLNQLSIYWLTEISEKHPQNCILKNLFYLKLLYPEINYTGSDVAVILPSKAAHYVSAIQFFFENYLKGITTVTFNRSRPSKSNWRFLISHIRNFYRKVKKLRNTLSAFGRTSANSSNIVFTYYPQTWQQDTKRDAILGNVVQHAMEAKKNISYVPYFFNYENIGDFDKYKSWDSQLITAFPGYFSVFCFHVKVALLAFKIRRAQFDCKNYYFVNTEVLQHELLNLILNKTEYLFNYIWLQSYFKSLNGKSHVFYQDEFYPEGRLISSAVKNSNNKSIVTYGVQHGIFYEAHTVYSITDYELNSTGSRNGMPMPDKFIVWGSYFKNHFLKYNSISDDYVITAGNPKYCFFDKSVLTESVSERETLTILWCTTLMVDAVRQYNSIILPYLEKNSHIKVRMRCHPLVDLKSYFNNVIPDHIRSNIEFSNTSSIYEDLQMCDAVLTSSGTTVFLDAMFMGKAVLNHVNSDYYMGDLGDKEMIKINSLEDFEASIKIISSGLKSDIDYRNILEIGVDEWNKIII